jgi:predicted aminopeptidase
VTEPRRVVARGPRPAARGFLVLAVTLLLSSCYYLQAARGQLSLFFAREPIEELLADPDLDPARRASLERVVAARDFATEDLGLPDNGSYHHFVELEGERVAWNVFAAPELSLEPKQWCFPIAGCVTYRGYFSRAGADRYAGRLAADGWDVDVAPVAAYSTLGRFRDPVLDSMLAWPEPELAGLIFHELAHQQLYLPGDTAFNEGFATAVETIGLRRWLAAEPLAAVTLAEYAQRQQREVEFNALLAATRDELELLYASAADDPAKRSGKAQAYADLLQRYRTLRDEAWGGYPGYDAWFERPMNNARLLPVITYRSWDSAFVALYQEVGEDLPRFYRAAAVISELEAGPRRARLEALAAPD